MALKIAIIGSGIAGNTAAWLLRDRHDITVFEAGEHVGGHANTVDVPSASGPLAIDTGFIVFNDRTYPEFNRLLDSIGQPWQPSVMSFSVHSRRHDFEYNGGGLNALFAQRRNLLRPAFWRMLRDILRFNREAPALLGREECDSLLGDYLRQHRYGREFVDLYLLPMAGAIWSSPAADVRDMPVSFLVRFFLNHGLLQLRDRPRWRVIRGGSREYVRRLTAGHRERIRLGCKARRVSRRAGGVYVHSGSGGEERFDSVFLACHSDQALALLAAPTQAERDVLGAIRYQRNEAVLHTDRSLLPRRRRAWAAWNCQLPSVRDAPVAVTYNMNILQALPVSEQYLVTLNGGASIARSRVLRRMSYEHPVFGRCSEAAQRRQAELNAGGRTLFCGAYWRNGFHEDGVVSAIAAVRHFEEALANAQLHIRRAG